jgi:hypothetical protein
VAAAGRWRSRVGEVVLAQDAGVLVRVVEVQEVELDELEQLVESWHVAGQPGSVAEEVADTIEGFFDGADGSGLVPLVQLAPDRYIWLSPSGHRFAETSVRRYVPAASAFLSPRTAHTLNSKTSAAPTP